MKIAVIGAGNAGLSFAGDLTLRGAAVVAVYDRYPSALEDVRARGGVELVGPVRSGFAQIPVLTSDIAEALTASDLIIIAVPAFAHAWVAEAMAPHMQEGQTVVLCPGYLGGSLVFRNAFVSAGTADRICLVELSSLPYATRIVGPAQVGIKGVKRQLLAAALPHRDTSMAMDRIAPFFPKLSAADTVLAVGLMNTNPISHVPTYLLNLGRLRSLPDDAHFDWHDLITDEIQRVSAALETEHRLIGDALGVETLSQKAIWDLYYEGEKWQIIQPTGKGLPSSASTVPERFITEDVPMGLVPIASLGQVLGVPTPVSRGLIDIASAVKEVDYWSQGRTAQSLGLQGLRGAQMLEAVQ